MSHSPFEFLRRGSARFRERLGRRAVGVGATLLAELLLILLLLTLSPDIKGPEKDGRTTTFSMEPDRESAPVEPEEAPVEPQERAPVEREIARTPEPVPDPAPVSVPVATAPPPPVVPMPRQQTTPVAPAPPSYRPAADAPARAVAGPPNRGGGPPDTARVEGSGPNGEPLYAAAWYREPYPEELRGYLSTSRGPGWGLIACRTVRDYRVEDCVIVGESPPGSNIARSVLAAAWQFRVRPPRIGGEVQVGAWVRIRIDYQQR
ncbi:hypothetical protein ASG29_04470 [Sphingomonas sp. Leaf412]|uniref:hypothetical protein n=1 Tax=Sphingomonas sp. Leaf412 TaxID=1736370 RepID=UPI0006FF97F6|nr:hypothetical protein [Sphingomonas sp. Leaf412]KQT33324.1 hypothetical protein ASG29_04470 [Sphingomonas sp. Leaf412]